MLRGKKLVVMFAVLAVSVCSAQANFVDDMEAGIGNWSPDTSNLSVETVNLAPGGGAQALRIENLGGQIVGAAYSTDYPGTYFPVSPDTDYTFSFDYYGYDTSVYFGLYIFDDEGSTGGGTADFGWTSNAWST